jgi:hypothetical protein
VKKKKVIYLSSGQLSAPAPVCPACTKLLDGFTAITNDSRRPRPRPTPGDVTWCVYCFVWYEFYGEPLKLRALSQDEVAKVPEEMRALHRQMVIDHALNPAGDDWLRRPN